MFIPPAEPGGININAIFIVFSLQLGGRLMVGLQVLVLAMCVRVTLTQSNAYWLKPDKH